MSDSNIRSRFKTLFVRSPPQEPPLPPTFDKPWRNLPWGDNGRNLQYVQEYKPENEDIKHLRVLLYGSVGAGKSSFINSVTNVIRRRMTISAAVSATTSDRSYTKKFQTHKIQTGRGTKKTYYPVVFNDIMGLEEGTDSGVLPEDIMLAMKGHVMEGYKFKLISKLSENDRDYNPAPAPDDKVHVLVCVLSANVSEIKESVLQKMSSVREAADDLGIPQMAIMTNIDAACPDTEKDLKNVYKSRYLQKKMKEFSSTVGIPMNCIFPVKNYSHEIDLNDDVDTLILSALRNMIDFGDDFIEKLA
ncbi:interferon-induced protein 44-like isoform X1 [Parambassis ranga]|uniref:Interferon-induced protein 44-like isoform X1 n=1 Tax=Parambassis ranga TaxID=210632 RepID=A0A6P7H6Q0_9TELE|nr:interferon-induced protein 44-like isoform X1 [Parambassis ranga]